MLPVYDQAVRCALGRPQSFRLDLRAALRADGRALQRGPADLRQAAGLPGTVSALRVCDVVVWMHHRWTTSGAAAPDRQRTILKPSR
ncbi:DUF6308 family protein [Streptomyces sp. NPDC004050]